MNDIKVTVTFTREEYDDDSPDISYLEQDYKGDDNAERYRAQDAERLAAFRRGDWHMIGIRAVATIWVARGNYRTNYDLKSPGVWGIESDSDEAYLESVFREECDALHSDIAAMGTAEFKL